MMRILGCASMALTVVFSWGRATLAQETRPASTAPATTARTPPVTPAAPAPQTDPRMDRLAEILASLIDRAHAGGHWRTRAALQCDMLLKAGDTTVLEARLTFAINSAGIRLEGMDGVTLGTDGKVVWVSPAAAPALVSPALGQLLLWRLLVSAPFQGQEPGAKCTKYLSRPLIGGNTDTLRLAGAPASASSIHCLVGAEPRSHQLTIVADLNVLGRASPPGAGDLPATQAVVFSDPQAVEAVSLPMAWTIYEWGEPAGVKGKPIGSGRLSNVQFVTADAALFTQPADARPEGDHPASDAEASRDRSP